MNRLDPEAPDHPWRTSSFSAETECVAVSNRGEIIGMRNSKDPDAGTLFVRREVMARLLASAKTGELDYLTS